MTAGAAIRLGTGRCVVPPALLAPGCLDQTWPRSLATGYLNCSPKFCFALHRFVYFIIYPTCFIPRDISYVIVHCLLEEQPSRSLHEIVYPKPTKGRKAVHILRSLNAQEPLPLWQIFRNVFRVSARKHGLRPNWPKITDIPPPSLTFCGCFYNAF